MTVPQDMPRVGVGPPEVIQQRILYVEDHSDTAEVVSRLLQSCGHDVTVAGTVDEARRLCAEGARFDLLIVDRQLPDGDGTKLLEFARKHGCARGIVLSADGMEEHVEASRNAGYSAHLVKPVRFAVLSAAMESTAVWYVP